MNERIKEFLSEQAEALAERTEDLRKAPVEATRKAMVKSAKSIKSLNDPVHAFAHSGVKLTAISQGTAQRLIELQEAIVTSAINEAAMQLERAARMESPVDALRDQAEVLRATRERIVSDMSRAMAIFKEAGGEVRKVASQTYAKVARTAEQEMPAVVKRARRKAKRKVAKAVRRARTAGRPMPAAVKAAPRKAKRKVAKAVRRAR